MGVEVVPDMDVETRGMCQIPVPYPKTNQPKSALREYLSNEVYAIICYEISHSSHNMQQNLLTYTIPVPRYLRKREERHHLCNGPSRCTI